MNTHSTGENHAGPSNSGTHKYRVETSDVIQEMRVNVFEESTNTVIWFKVKPNGPLQSDLIIDVNSKERFLGDDEIIENVVHNPTNTVLWTIHRPLRGWYIRIRSPGFPPGVFIPLTPVPSTSQLHTDAAITFNTRTNMTTHSPELPTSDSQFTLQDADTTSSSSSLHSYPPTPTAVINVQPPSPSKTPKSIDNTPRKSLRRLPRRSSQITQFLLSPSSIQPLQEAETGSFFARALSVLKSHRPSHSNSFTLSRVLDASSSGAPPPYVSNVSISGPSQSSAAILSQQVHLHVPLLVFHDHTPVLTVRSLTGLLEIDKSEEIYLGVDTGFWIAIALTYLEFLEERESYLAALSD